MRASHAIPPYRLAWPQHQALTSTSNTVMTSSWGSRTDTDPHALSGRRSPYTSTCSRRQVGHGRQRWPKRSQAQQRGCRACAHCDVVPPSTPAPAHLQVVQHAGRGPPRPNVRQLALQVGQGSLHQAASNSGSLGGSAARLRRGCGKINVYRIRTGICGPTTKLCHSSPLGLCHVKCGCAGICHCAACRPPFSLCATHGMG